MFCLLAQMGTAIAQSLKIQTNINYFDFLNYLYNEFEIING